MEERKDRRVLKVVALLFALGLAMAWGMVVGGGLVYAWTHFIEQPERQSRVKAIVLRDRLQEERQGLQPLGALVVEVVPNSPADRAGLQDGDRIVAVDGQRLGFAGDLADLIAQYEPGDRVVLVIRRSGEDPFELRVRLGEHPDQEGHAYLGVRYSPSLNLQVPGLQVIPFDESEGSFRFEVPFDLDDLPGGLQLHVVPGWDDSF